MAEKHLDCRWTATIGTDTLRRRPAMMQCFQSLLWRCLDAVLQGSPTIRTEVIPEREHFLTARTPCGQVRVILPGWLFGGSHVVQHSPWGRVRQASITTAMDTYGDVVTDEMARAASKVAGLAL